MACNESRGQERRSLYDRCADISGVPRWAKCRWGRRGYSDDQAVFDTIYIMLRTQSEEEAFRDLGIHVNLGVQSTQVSEIAAEIADEERGNDESDIENASRAQGDNEDDESSESVDEGGDSEDDGISDEDDTEYEIDEKQESDILYHPTGLSRDCPKLLDRSFRLMRRHSNGLYYALPRVFYALYPEAQLAVDGLRKDQHCLGLIAYLLRSRHWISSDECLRDFH